MMRRRSSLLLLAAVLAAPATVLAQDAWQAPRTPHGQPDLQGLWTNSTTTPSSAPRT